ncbi:hypothetical protein [Chroococcidiopsis thermalis]|nr:hypothetical protein [Chroococcidiopsis thermalis]
MRGQGRQGGQGSNYQLPITHYQLPIPYTTLHLYSFYQKLS